MAWNLDSLERIYAAGANDPSDHDAGIIMDLVKELRMARSAIAIEIEACAKECEDAATLDSAASLPINAYRTVMGSGTQSYLDGFVAGCERSATRIRARLEERK